MPPPFLPGDLELRLIARHQGRRGTARRMASGPGPVSRPGGRIGVVGWTPPPPLLGVILGGLQPGQIRASRGPNFSGFLPPCGAAPRGGGGAPPTTLILLRNQRRRARLEVAATNAGSEGPQAQYCGLDGQARGFPRTGRSGGVFHAVAGPGAAGVPQGTEEAVAISTKRSG